MDSKKFAECPKCGGQGLIPDISLNTTVFKVVVTMTADYVINCDICHGSGWIRKQTIQSTGKPVEVS